MKLKKIASLMLAGIMAVSMLAGCKNASSDTTDPETPVTPVTGAAAAVNAELDENGDQINFTESDVLKTLLTDYYSSHDITMAQAKNAKTIVEASAKNDDLVETVVSVLNANAEARFKYVYPNNNGANYYVANCGQTGYEANANDKKVTNVEVYVLNAERLTEAGALKLVGQYVDDLDLPKVNAAGDKNYSYTGSVASVKAETENGEGSVWVIAVTITQTNAAK